MYYGTKLDPDFIDRLVDCVPEQGRPPSRGLPSRERLYVALQAMAAQGLSVHLPKTYQALSNEVFGRKAFIFVSCDSEEHRQSMDYALRDLGYKPDFDYNRGGTTAEIRVAYFKGWHWDE